MDLDVELESRKETIAKLEETSRVYVMTNFKPINSKSNKARCSQPGCNGAGNTKGGNTHRRCVAYFAGHI